MSKLKLQVENIAVESFPTGKTDGHIGTVEARERLATRPQVCDPFTLPPRCA
jgi:hypothetical protein